VSNRKHRGKFALAAPHVEVVLVPEEQPTSADQVALAAGTLFDAYLVLHVPDGEPPKTIRLETVARSIRKARSTSSWRPTQRSARNTPRRISSAA
jgi:hypothetical protein